MENIVALMPMRHYSARVAGKNYRPFGDGRPLFFHMAEKLLNCNQIDRVVIDTDSKIILEFCAENFPKITTIMRPRHLCAEDCPMNDVLLHDVNQFPAKHYIQTHATNPLLSIETLEKSLAIYKEQYPKYDSLFSVTKIQTRFWDGVGRPVNHNPNILLRTQDLPPFYEENSCIYIFDSSTLINNHNRIGSRPYLFEIEPREAMDIDEEIDFELAEKLFLIEK